MKSYPDQAVWFPKGQFAADDCPPFSAGGRLSPLRPPLSRTDRRNAVGAVDCPAPECLDSKKCGGSLQGRSFDGGRFHCRYRGTSNRGLGGPNLFDRQDGGRLLQVPEPSRHPSRSGSTAGRLAITKSDGRGSLAPRQSLSGVQRDPSLSGDGRSRNCASRIPA